MSGTANAITRRSFLRAVGAGMAAVGLASFAPFRVSGQSVELKILTWQHFVPAFDEWFDGFAQAWGQSQNPAVTVTVDHISFANLLTRATAEVAAGAGHDLFFNLSPLTEFEPDTIDHKDIVQAVESKHGPITQLAKNSIYNPVTNRWTGFSDFFTIDPYDYHKDIWQAIDLPQGPTNYRDLLDAGLRIKALQQQGQFPEVQIPIGVGFYNDVDSNMFVRALLWSFEGAVQDANENVTLASAETLASIVYGAVLWREAIGPATLTWTAPSNNQALNAHATSIILNSISAYRAAQDNNLKLPTGGSLADNTFFTGALPGPQGVPWASEHVMGVWVIWNFAQQPDLAKEFLVTLMDNYGPDGFAAPAKKFPNMQGIKGGTLNSKLYNTPSFLGAAAPSAGSTMAEQPRAGWQWLQQQFTFDPFHSNPTDKLVPLFSAIEEPRPDGTVKAGWATNIGHPGSANPAIGEIFDTFVLPQMYVQAPLGHLSPDAALQQADQQVKTIFSKWRDQKLVGGDPTKDLAYNPNDPKIQAILAAWNGYLNKTLAPLAVYDQIASVL